VQEIGYTGSRGDGGGTSGMSWQLYSLLERLLLCGPVGACGGSKKGFVSIDVLELDVLSGMAKREHATDERQGGQGPESGSRPAPPHAERLRWTISRGILALLEMYRGAASKGQIFYKRVGTIRVMLDGELQLELDLARSLAGMQYSILTDGFYPNSPSRWWRFMKDIRENREQAGLPVLPFTELQES